MKIFMSWSGERSRSFAEDMKLWLEQVLPGTDVWLSSQDLDKGTIWFSDIVSELQDCNCGVICVTRENHLAPWIHFEAGGMVKGLGKTHVATILLDIDHTELQQPLSLFNGLRVNRMGAFLLVKSFNNLSDHPIKERVLERLFDKFWPDLDVIYKLLFPDSHEVARNMDHPVHIAPKPDQAILYGRPTRKRRKPVETQPSKQPGLFNGGDE